MERKERRSGIELLKVIAVLLIVMSHVAPIYSYENSLYTINPKMLSNDIQIIILQIFRYLGQIGDAIFLICSSYFLLDSKKCNYNKWIHLYGDLFVWTYFYMFISFFWDNDITYRLFGDILPFTETSYWFLPAYLFLYLMHPYLNLVIESLNKNQLFRITLFLVVVYGCVNYFIQGVFWGTLLTNCFAVYFTVAYIKKYLFQILNNIKINIVILICSILTLISTLPILYFTANNITFYDMSDNALWGSYFFNPIIMLIGFSSFSIFINLDFKSKIVNYISSLSLLVYLIHSNYHLQSVYMKVFKYIYDNYTYKYIALWCFGLSIIVFIVSTIIASVYKLLIQKYVYKLFDNILLLLKKIENRLLGGA